MHGKINFTKGTTPEHLSDPVERYISGWWLGRCRESSLNFLHNISNLLWSRAKLWKLGLCVESLLRTDDLAVESLLVDIRGYLTDFLFVILRDKPSLIDIWNHSLWPSHNIRLINAVLGASWAVWLWLSHSSRALLGDSRLRQIWSVVLMNWRASYRLCVQLWHTWLLSQALRNNLSLIVLLHSFCNIGMVNVLMMSWSLNGSLTNLNFYWLMVDVQARLLIWTILMLMH